MQGDLQTLVESLAQAFPPGAQDDFRILMTGVIDQVTSISPGGNWLRAGGVAANSSSAPSGAFLSIAASNGAYNITVVNPNKNKANQNIFYEISYCATKGFTTSVNTLAPNAATSVTLNLPGTSYFFRVRATYDFVNWSSYSLASQSKMSSGLVSSAATSEAGAFNQTNYGLVTSVAVGGTAEVSINGSNGPLTALVTQKGPTQRALPSATIVGVVPGSSLFVGFDGQKYVLRPTLAGLLSDDGMTPIGKVSVVGTATPTLPTIVPILSGGQILGYNVTNGGAGASEPYTLTLGATGGGTGATFGEQTIVAGVLIAVAPGNPGSGYSGGTTVTASGGSGGGTPGGGTAVGGNGGRLTAV